MSFRDEAADIYYRGKLHADAVIHEWGVIFLLLLVTLSSFGLGRLSALMTGKPAVALTASTSETKPETLYMGDLIVASRSGGLYYYPWCAGAAKLAPGNQVWFTSQDAAEAAGYRPAKTCKGLTN